MRVSWIAVPLGLLLVAGCGASATPRGTPTPRTSASSPPTTPTTPAAAEVSLRVYFLRGEHVYAVHRSTRSSAVAAAAMTALLGGPTAAEAADGLSSAIPAGTTLRGINLRDGVATVDLSSSYASGGGSASMFGRLAQVVYTLTQFPTVAGVRFQLDGRAVTTFSGEGIVLDHPQTRADYEAQTPAILIEHPARGETVSSPLTVSGSANVFEAVLRIRVRDSAGRELVNQRVMATSGTGTRGTFTAVVTFAAATGSTVTVEGFSTSPKDGAEINDYPVPVTVGAPPGSG